MKRTSVIVTAAALTLLLTGCDATFPVAGLAKTDPQVISTRMPVEVQSKKVLVVTPASFQQTSADLTQEATKTSDAQSNATTTKKNVLTTLEYNVMGTALEAELLNNGWHPVSQSMMAKAMYGTTFRNLMQSFRSRGDFDLLQAALILGKETKSNYVLLVKFARISKQESDNVCPSYLVAPTLEADISMTDIQSGEIVWHSSAIINPTDLFKKAFIVPAGQTDNNCGVTANGRLSRVDLWQEWHIQGAYLAHDIDGISHFVVSANSWDAFVELEAQKAAQAMIASIPVQRGGMR